MEKVILVPLDGTSAAEQVLPVALGIAHAVDATVELAHVHAIPQYLSGAPPLETSLDREEAEHMRKPIAALAQRVAREHGIVVTARLLVGPVAATLERYTAERPVWLTVMATHGRGGLSRAWLGSVADRLVRGSPAPVLLVRRGDGSAMATPQSPLASALVPLDGSDLAESVLGTVSALLGQSAGGEIVLLHVIVPPPPLAPFSDTGLLVDQPDTSTSDAWTAASARSIEAAHVYLDGIAARLLEQGVRARTEIATHRSPARAILAYADQSGADLIALATHGRGGIARAFMGSVADKVIRGATMSVLVVRPAQSPTAPSPESTEERAPTQGF